MHHLWVGFIGGLAAFPHCLGMCGGFILHFSGTREGRTGRQLLWFGGKTVTYACSGAIAGYSGGRIQQLMAAGNMGNILSYAMGGAICLTGVMLLGLLPQKGVSPSAQATPLSTLCSRLSAPPGAGSALLLGIIAAILPCPVVLAFLAYSLQSGSPLTGMTTMAAMGAGTLGPLLLLGAAGGAVRGRCKTWGGRIGGLVLLFLGITTILRGTETYHRFLGCPGTPALQQPAPGDGQGCCSGTNHGKRPE